MAKKKTKIPIKDKLKVKKPVKRCEPAIDNIVRIRNNEQAKLRRLKAKFDAIPGGKKGKGRKTEADQLRKSIKSYERGINELKGTVKTIRGACEIMNDNKGKIKSLRLKTSHIDRKLKKMYDSRDFNQDLIKKLNKEALTHQNEIRALNKVNSDVIYRVNKGLGFEPKNIVEALKLRKKDLKKTHKEDFDEDYFEKEELEEVEPGGGGGAVGAGDMEGLEALEELVDEVEEEAEFEIDRGGYIEEMDEPFWQVSQDYSRNESNRISDYDQVTISWSGGNHFRFAGKSIMLIDLKFKEMVRWCDSQSTKGTDESVARITKSITPDGTRLKYHGYIIEEGKL